MHCKYFISILYKVIPRYNKTKHMKDIQISGSFINGILNAFKSIHALTGEQEHELLNKFDDGGWYDYNLFNNTVQKVLENNKGQDFSALLVRAGMIYIYNIFHYGGAQHIMSSYEAFINLQADSSAYEFGVKGPSREVSGWVELKEFDKKQGRAIVRNVVPFPSDFAQGVYLGGMNLNNDLDYYEVFVEHNESQYPNLNDFDIVILFKEKNIEGNNIIDENVNGIIKNKSTKVELNNIDKETLFWKYAQLKSQLNQNQIYQQQLDDILSRKTNELFKQGQSLKSYIETNVELENFLFLSSHDLRTPIQNIINFIHLLNEESFDKFNPQEIKYLEYINNNSQRLEDTINGLLNYSIIKNKNIVLSSINTYDLFNEIIQENKDIIISSNANIQIKKLPNIKGDVNQLKTLFENLLLNALKFVNKEVEPVILIDSEEQENHFLFKIVDNGIGIDNNSKEIIFGIFKRLNLREEYEGIGIGLSICKNIVEKHKGTIWVESDIGIGSTFYFTLPK